MNKSIRNKRIVELLKKGYSYRRIADRYGTTYQTVGNIKFKCLGSKRIFRQHEFDMQYRPIKYSLDPRGVFMLTAYLLRCAIRDYYHKKLNAKELDKIGSFFDLKRLSKVARRKIKYRQPLRITYQ